MSDQCGRTAGGLYTERKCSSRGVVNPVLLHRCGHDDVDVGRQRARELVRDTVQFRPSEGVRAASDGDGRVVEGEDCLLSETDSVPLDAVTYDHGAVARL